MLFTRKWCERRFAWRMQKKCLPAPCIAHHEMLCCAEEGNATPSRKPSSASPTPSPRPPLRESGLPAVHEIIHNLLVALGPCIVCSGVKPWPPSYNMLRSLNLIILSQWHDRMSTLWACPVRCKPLCDATGVKVVLAGEDEELAGRRR